METVLSENDRRHLENRIAEAEKLTKSQIVLATVNRSDSYLEIPWKAFALGVSVTAFMVFLIDVILFRWSQGTAVLLSIAITLAVAASLVVLTILVPGVARVFLSDSRAETETRQYAESLFLSKELFSTTGRKGILLLISRFERKVVILPDRGLDGHVNKKDLDGIIELMKRPLAKHQFREALEIALDELIRIIEPLPGAESVRDELPNTIIEEKGL